MEENMEKTETLGAARFGLQTTLLMSVQ